MKGAGEGGITAVGGALANAVSNALGIQVTRLPMKPDYLFGSASATPLGKSLVPVESAIGKGIVKSWELSTYMHIGIRMDA